MSIHFLSCLGATPTIGKVLKEVNKKRLMNDFILLGIGVWGNWSSWSECAATCKNKF